MPGSGKIDAVAKGTIGGVLGTVTLGPVYIRTEEVMSSSRHHNTEKNVGILSKYTNRLAHSFPKKLNRFFRRKDRVVLQQDGTRHLLENGPNIGGHFDYQAYHEFGPDKKEPAPEPQIKPEKSDDLTRASNALETLKRHRRNELPDLDETVADAVAIVGLDGIKERRDIQAEAIHREFIMEMLLQQLPGLDTHEQDWLRPNREQIDEAAMHYQRRIDKINQEIAALGEMKSLTGEKPSEEFRKAQMAERDRCLHCKSILHDALMRSESESPKKDCSDFWWNHLRDRWNEFHEDDRDSPDLFAIVRRDRDVDAIAKHHKFVFLPQELCLLELDIAVQELLEIYHSNTLSTEQFAELIHAVACGWPGVKEDAQSPSAERRANAAGCVRSLAQLANQGALPREVLSRFREFDEINGILLEHVQARKIAALFKAQQELRELDASDPKGKGKEREIDDPKRKDLAARIGTLKQDIKNCPAGLRS
jgi:hypothetical protein